MMLLISQQFVYPAAIDRAEEGFYLVTLVD
jgi:hypothetical protein